MDSASLLYNFRIGFDIIASGEAPGFTDTQVYSLLNRAQDYIIDELIDRKQYQFLGKLLKIGLELTVTSHSGNGFIGQIPTVEESYAEYSFWKILSASATITRSGFSTSGLIRSNSGQSIEPIKLLSPEDFEKWDKSISDFGRNSYIRFYNPVGTISDSGLNDDFSLIIRADAYTTIEKADITYVTKREDISASQECQLSEKVHRQVVDKAIDIAKTIINIQTPQSSNT